MVSVVMPAFNKEKYIVKAIKSVLNQTYQDIELIIIDDCSTDKTVERISEISDERMRVICLSENHGACYARNMGIEKANGEYIAFQDADNFWYPEKIVRSLDTLKEQNTDCVFCKGKLYFPNNVIQYVPRYNLNQYTNKKHMILIDNCIDTPSLFGKREVFESIMFDNSMPKLQDWDLAVRLIDQYRVYYIDECMYEGMVDNTGLTLNIDKSVIALEKMIEKYKDEIDKDKRIKANFLNRLGSAYEVISSGKSEYAYLFRQSLVNCFSFKVLVKYIAAVTHIYPIYTAFKYSKDKH